MGRVALVADGVSLLCRVAIQVPDRWLVAVHRLLAQDGAAGRKRPMGYHLARLKDQAGGVALLDPEASLIRGERFGLAVWMRDLLGICDDAKGALDGGGTGRFVGSIG